MDGGELFRAVLGDPLAQFPGGGSWAQDAGVWTESDLIKLQAPPLGGHDDWPEHLLDQPLDFFDLNFDDEPPPAAANQAMTVGGSSEMDEALVGLPAMGSAAGADQVVVSASLEQTQGQGGDQPLDFDSFFGEQAPSAAATTAATKQAAPGDSFAIDQVFVGSPGMGYLPSSAPLAAGADQGVCASLEQTQVQGTDPPPPPPPAAVQIAGQNPLGADQLEHAADVPTAAAPDGDMELAWIFSAAAQCGEADGAVWSEEEQSVLVRGLALHANDHEDVSGKCLRIAYHLPNKTAFDVALRWRWLKKKNETVKQPELVQKDYATKKVEKVWELFSKVSTSTAAKSRVEAAFSRAKLEHSLSSGKGKGTKVAKNKSKSYPLSKEAIDSKSSKELIKDNDMFLKRIEDNLKSGKLDNTTTNYFYYVKTNMDVIEKRGKEFGINMITMPPIDEEGLETILRSRQKIQLHKRAN
ncbi:hypothetical protein ACP4OV_022591 [Aristida adscensionis]